VSGPGLSGDYFYLIDHSFALIMLQFKLESLEIQAYNDEMTRIIGAPCLALAAYYRQFEEVGLTAASNQDPTAQFQWTKRTLTTKLDKTIKEYWYVILYHFFLLFILPFAQLTRKTYGIRNHLQNRHKLKMTDSCLSIALEKGQEMCRTFTEKRILLRYTQDNDANAFWRSKSLAPGDWAALVRWCLSTQIHENVLTSVEQHDLLGFHLEVQHSSFRTFLGDLFDGKVEDHLKSVKPVDGNRYDDEFRLLRNTVKDVVLPSDVLQKLLRFNDSDEPVVEKNDSDNYQYDRDKSESEMLRKMTISKNKIYRHIPEKEEEEMKMKQSTLQSKAAMRSEYTSLLV
jgi:hypothetical protein